MRCRPREWRAPHGSENRVRRRVDEHERGLLFALCRNPKTGSTAIERDCMCREVAARERVGTPDRRIEPRLRRAIARPQSPGCQRREIDGGHLSNLLIALLPRGALSTTTLPALPVNRRCHRRKRVGIYRAPLGLAPAWPACLALSSSTVSATGAKIASFSLMRSARVITADFAFDGRECQAIRFLVF